MASRRSIQGGWCILRTCGRSTLPLAKSLAESGLEVWTPSQSRRHPRTKAERPVPIMPTFVFARARHLWTLASLAEDPTSPHPDFSVFRYLDRFPVIADDELTALRKAEARAAPLPTADPFAKDEGVFVTEGVCGGLGGQVIRSNEHWTLVCFGGHMRVNISTFILKPIVANGLQPETGTAAQAA